MDFKKFKESIEKRDLALLGGGAGATGGLAWAGSHIGVAALGSAVAGTVLLPVVVAGAAIGGGAAWYYYNKAGKPKPDKEKPPNPAGNGGLGDGLD